MRTNRLRQIWKEGGRTVNAWLGIPSAFSAELMAHQGFESVTVDMQHGVIDYETAVQMLQAISTTDAVPLVRVPWREAGIVMKMLDAGAYGVICPMVNSRAEAEELVSFCRYPPLGQRSFGPIRASLYGGADYHDHANREVLVLAMIETKKALDHLDDILSVPGLDGVYVGPSDLALSLGFRPGADPTDPAMLEAISHILETVRGRGLFAGIHCLSAGFARRMWELGYHMTSLLSDGRLMVMKTRELLAELRAGAGGSGVSGY
ncbi:4-hydroxy-2-oxo-heptane-1,7-dioate aldolase [bacterium HR40]|nr:4-hydroxy-2-oxo-heptane-1,7-dioate aldolase [bacterium HR40]